MSATTGLHPAFCDYIGDVLEVDVKESNGVYSNLREYVCLCGSCEQE